MGLQSFKHVILFFFGLGTMMDFLKHEGTTDRERDRLKMSVKTPASWKAHALSTRPGIPSGPTALRMFTRLKDRVTSATESVSGLTSSAAAAAAAAALSVFFAHLIVLHFISLHILLLFLLFLPYVCPCVMLLYIICILIILHCPLSGPDSITFHF